MKLQNLPKIPVEKLLKNLKLIYEKLPEKTIRKNANRSIFRCNG